MDPNKKRIIISRTDSIGDVMLTLPICKWIKDHNPDSEIIFLGKAYTGAVTKHFSLIDEVEDWNDYLKLPRVEALEKLKSLRADVIVHVFPNTEIAKLAKKAGIKMRIGTSHRSFHLLTCTHRVNFTRRRSNLHEAQLNHELLRPLGLNHLPSMEEILDSLRYLRLPDVKLPEPFGSLKSYTILHPKSQGSAREWPIEKYMELANKLVEQGKTVVFTGTETEGKLFRDLIPASDKIYDSTGKLSLEELMVLIGRAENLVACSTGPLHIAGYYGVNTIGLFSPKRPIHPGRWKALGKRAHALVFDENCSDCDRKKNCACISRISVESVLEKIA